MTAWPPTPNTLLALQTSDQTRWRAYAGQAEHHTLRARQTRAWSYNRSRVLDEIRLARVRLGQREPVESVEVATTALGLAERVRSSLVDGFLIRYHGDLVARHGGEAVVDDFTSQLRDYLRRVAPTREGDVIAVRD